MGPKSVAFVLLLFNLLLYSGLTIVAGWAVNYAIDEIPKSDFVVPVKLFPMIFPIGNMATGFLVIFSLLAGTVGVAASLTGLRDIARGDPRHLSAAAASSLTAWPLTLLAMGAACKEISMGWRIACLRSMEALAIVLSGTQLLCSAAVHASINSAPVARSLDIEEL